MKIYVAAKWEDRPNARQLMDQLEVVGHTITHDWTTCEQVSPEAAQGDYAGVLTADVLVLLCEHDAKYMGSLVEVGIALGRGLDVFVIGDACDGCIFWQLSQIRKTTRAGLLGALEQWELNREELWGALY